MWMDLDDTFFHIVRPEFLCILFHFTAISGIASPQADIKMTSGEPLAAIGVILSYPSETKLSKLWLCVLRIFSYDKKPSEYVSKRI